MQEPAVARPGSPRWHARLFATPETRDTLDAVFALERELWSIADTQLDHGVAHIKLQWWHEEAGRLAQRQPRHPLTQALAARHATPADAETALLEYLRSVELDLARTTYESATELEHYLQYCAALQRLAAAALAPDADPQGLAAFATAVGRLVRSAEILRDLRQDAWDGRVYVPLDWLAAEGVDPAALREAEAPPGVARCLQRLASEARQHWAAESAAAPGADSLRGLRVLAALHLALIDRLEQAGFAVGLQRLEPGPLRSLWTAWRAARTPMETA